MSVSSRCNESSLFRRLHLARKLEKLHEDAAAFRAGAISHRHVVVVANAYTPARAEQMAGLEGELVDAAQKRCPSEPAGIVRHVTDAIDGDGGAAADDAAYERRACYTATTLGGDLDVRANGDHAEGRAFLNGPTS